MAILEIKKFGSSVLRKRTDPIENVTRETQRLIDDMFETMYAAEGIGLAAPQVGVSQDVIVVDVSPHDPAAERLAFVNPEIASAEGEVVGEEGCLSFPGITGDVRRAETVRVRALDREGRPFEVSLDGIAARVVQHEIDHLRGILVVDHLSTVKRSLLRGQLRRLKKEGGRQARGRVEEAEEAVDAGR